MSYSKAEKAKIDLISENAYFFLKQNPRYLAGYYFSQYVAQTLIQLYFQEPKNHFLYHDFIVILQQKLALFVLESLKKNISLSEVNQKMEILEREQTSLMLFFHAKTSPEQQMINQRFELKELPYLEQYQSHLEAHCHEFMGTFSAKFRLQEGLVQKKLDQLLQMYQQIQTYASLAFMKALSSFKDGQEVKEREFARLIKANLIVDLGTQNTGFIQSFGFYTLGAAFLIASVIMFSLPYFGVALGFNANILSLSLLATSALSLLINALQPLWEKDVCEEKYTHLFKI